MANYLRQIFIFCAGRGERMMPLTANSPKPLLEVGNKKILDHILAKLNHFKTIDKIIINAHYLSEKIIEHVKSLNNPKIIISLEKDKIETGGGLVYALDKIDLNQPLLTLNGDVIWQDGDISDIDYLFGQYNKFNHDFLLGLKKKNEFSGYDGIGDFALKGQKLIRDFAAPNSLELSHVYVGMQIINPQILTAANINSFGKSFSISQFYKQAALTPNHILNRVEGVELKGKYFHIGTPQNLDLARQNYIN